MVEGFSRPFPFVFIPRCHLRTIANKKNCTSTITSVHGDGRSEISQARYAIGASCIFPGKRRVFHILVTGLQQLSIWKINGYIGELSVVTLVHSYYLPEKKCFGFEHVSIPLATIYSFLNHTVLVKFNRFMIPLHKRFSVSPD